MINERLRGFTLIELLVVAAIIALFAGGSIAAIRSFQERQTLVQESRKFKDHLRSIQTAAQTGTKPSSGCPTMKSMRVEYDSASSYRVSTVCLDSYGSEIFPVSKTHSLSSGLTFANSFSQFDFQVLSQGISNGANICITDGSRYYRLLLTDFGGINDFGIVDNLSICTSAVAGNTITVRAYGTPVDNGYPNMRLKISGSGVRDWTVTDTLSLYTYNSSSPVSISDIAVAFTNDAYRPPQDRNLFVDFVELDGIRFETEAPTVNRTGCGAGHRQTQWLYCNGEFQYGQ